MEIKIIQKEVTKVFGGEPEIWKVAEVYVNGVKISTNEKKQYDSIGIMVSALLHGNHA